MTSNGPTTEVGAPALGPAHFRAGEAKKSSRHTYGQILKSSALVGGSSALNMGIQMLRTKALALLLDTSGFGLFVLYSSISDPIATIAGMGINSSGVRQIAAAVGSGETERIARTVVVLRRTAFVLGLFGALLLIAFCRPLSVLTFGNDGHAGAVALLSLGVFFSAIAGGQTALIQGMRRIADLAAMGVVGALCGALLTIVLVLFLREQGVAPALVAVAAMSMITSFCFSRKVRIQTPPLTLSQVRQEVASLLQLGFVFMATGLLTTGAASAIKIIIGHSMGLGAAAVYQSAWTLGGVYIAFILQSMSADFYPRLTAIAGDNPECNRLVNEQARISLLLAGPGVIGTLTLAPLVIALFYSSKFESAVPVLRWVCVGMMLRVIAWPMGFIVVAKGAQKTILITEVLAAAVHVGLAWLCLKPFGLAGAGAAFFGLYVWHGILIYLIVRRMSGFRWSAANLYTGLLFLSLIGVVFCGFYLLPFWAASCLGIASALASGLYSIRTLLHLVSFERIPKPIRNALVRLRLAPSYPENQPEEAGNNR